MDKRKGFTLIELLAVIVILAIIALIAVPVILNIIDKANKSAFKDTAYGVISAGELYFAEQQLELNGMSEDAEFTFPTDEIDIKGNVPNGTVLKVNTKGQTALAMSNGRYCITKGYNDTDVTITEEYEECKILKPKSFATDSWETIAANINSDVYKVGDTREIELEEFENGETDENGKQIKTYTVRIANKTNTGDVCTNDSFEKEDGTIETYSKTACGFVIEFEDIILNSGRNAQMNLSFTNVGGWKNSKMRKYVNETIYKALPVELRNVIIDTTVVSGHGSTSGETNFVTTDKVYLLSTREVWGKGYTEYDTARDNTRQLDYYKDYKNLNGSIGVSKSNHSGAIKRLNGSDQSWWLRSANSGGDSFFYIVSSSGDWGAHFYNSYGVAVAFRIG